GARSYSSIQNLAKPAGPGSVSPTEAKIPADPLQQGIAQHQRELAQAQERLLVQLRQFQQLQQDESQATTALAALGTRRQKLEEEQIGLGQESARRGRAAQIVAMSTSEIQARTRSLAEEIRQLEQLPPANKTLRYRTPVSRPLQSEELLFE